MKPAAFDYVLAESVAHAAAALSEAGGEAKIIAGGQSLVPMMNFRLVKPSVLVDINAVAGLDGIRVDGPREAPRLRVGALVRHVMTARDPIVARHAPIVTEAMKHVAHLTVRNRGTFCGSVCHADPVGEMAMMTVLLDGRVHAASVRGARTIPADAFFLGALATSLEPDEVVTAVDLAIPAEGTGHGFREYARRHGDYALAAVAVLLAREDGRARDARVAVMGVGELPMRLTAVEAALEGRAVSDGAVEAAVAVLRESISPGSDLNASADYRRHLAGALAGRAIRDAWASAREAARS